MGLRLCSQISVQQIMRETKPTYHCMIHGDLFELAEPEWAAQNDPPAKGVSGQTGNGNEADEGSDEEEQDKPAYLPAPPKGLVFRQVNEPQSEVMCDIFGMLSLQPSNRRSWC